MEFTVNPALGGAQPARRARLNALFGSLTDSFRARIPPQQSVARPAHDAATDVVGRPLSAERPRSWLFNTGLSTASFATGVDDGISFRGVENPGGVSTSSLASGSTVVSHGSGGGSGRPVVVGGGGRAGGRGAGPQRGKSWAARMLMRSNSVSSADAAEAEHGGGAAALGADGAWLSWRLPDALISDTWGHGVLVYFRYVQFVTLVALFLTALAAVPFSLNWALVRDRKTLAAAFAALYSPAPRVRGSWVATTALLPVVWMVATAAWRSYRIALVGRWRGEERTEESAEHGGDTITDAAVKSLTHRERACRRGLSVFVFVLLVGAQAVVTYYLHVALGLTDAAVLGLAVSAALSTLNLAEKTVAKMLTACEGHGTITGIREWDCAKSFFLKIANVLVVYLVQALTVDARKAAAAAAAAAEGNARGAQASAALSSSGVLLLSCLSEAELDSGRHLYAAHINAAGGAGWVGRGEGNLTSAIASFFSSSSPPAFSNITAADVTSGQAASYLAALGSTCSCPLLSMGWTFFFMLLTDVAFGTVVDYVISRASERFYRTRSASLGLSDEEMKAEFDTSEKYVGVWYRTFLILLGAPVFPMVAALGFVGFLVQYFYDRWALVHLCRRPLLKEEPMSLRLTTTCAIVVGAASVVTFPNGMAFIFARYSFGMSACHFFSGW